MLSVLSSRSLKFAVLAVALAAGGCDRQSPDAAQPQASAPAGPAAGTLDRSHKGEPLPDFTFRDPAGETLDMTALKGKPALVNLWATWCGPCVIELPTLDKLAADQALGVRVVTVSQDSVDPAKVEGFLDQRGLAALDPWLDPENDLSFHYATGTLPTTILYDAAGKEVWRYVGGREWDTPEARKLIAEAR